MANPLSDVKTWAYVIQDVGQAKIDQIGALPVDLVVVDQANRQGTLFNTNELDRLKGANDKQVISYLSIGEAETYRDYWETRWQSHPPAWLAEENPEWEGNIKVAYWDPDWQDIVFAMVDAIVDAGFDGLYLDIVDAFWYWEDIDPDAANGLYRDRMVDFVASIRAHAEARLAETGRGGAEFAIIGQNAEELAEDPDYLAAVDGIGKEDLYFYYPNGKAGNFDAVPAGWLEGSQDLLEQAEAAGVETFVIEYVPDQYRNQVIGEIRDEIRYLGALDAPLYLSSTRALDQIETMIDTDGSVRLWGSDAADRLNGTPWRDVAKGGKGADRLRGHDGNDRLLGGNGADNLGGGKGRDVLVGEGGRDRATGGAGADRFVFAPGDDKLAVTDFGRGNDLMDLRKFDLAGFRELSDAASQDGSRLVIQLGDDKLVLKDVLLADLSADDFIF